MVYKICCKDLGMHDDFEILESSIIRLISKMKRHLRVYHKMTIEELKELKINQLVRENISILQILVNKFDKNDQLI